MVTSPHTYRIDLSLQTDSGSKATLKELQRAFKDSDKDLDVLSADFKRFQDAGVDASHEYRKVLSDTIKDYDKQLGKLEEAQAKIIANRDISEEMRNQQLKEISDKKKRIKLFQRELDLRIKMQKSSGKVFDSESNLVKIRLKMLTVQEKLNKLLGKESKLRSAIGKAAKVGAIGLGVAGAVAGGVAAFGGAVIGASESVAQKGQALKSLREGYHKRDVDRLYVKTGADYSAIIAAINRVAPLTGGNNSLTLKLAENELLNPGSGMLIAAQKMPNLAINYKNIYDQIRKQTGVADTSALSASVLENRAVKTGRVGEIDAMLAFAKLTQAGLGSEDAHRIINRIAAGRGEKSFIEAFNEADISSMVRDRAMKNIIANQKLQISELDDMVLDESPEVRAARKAQEKLREFELHKEELFAKFIPVLLPLMEGVLNKLMDFMPKIVRGVGEMLKFMSIFTPADWGDALLDIGTDLVVESRFMEKERQLSKLQEEKDKLEEEMEDRRLDTAKTLKDVAKLQADLNGKMLSFFIEMEESGSVAKVFTKSFESLALPQNAQGGIVTSPSICGEAGPELVLPLNNPGRASTIINNYTNSNTFNMRGNQTALSLSQQISNNRFIRHACAF